MAAHMCQVTAFVAANFRITIFSNLKCNSLPFVCNEIQQIVSWSTLTVLLQFFTK
jgi:hypothetical protein